jgi:hypothetical protein
MSFDLLDWLLIGVWSLLPIAGLAFPILLLMQIGSIFGSHIKGEQK